MVVDHGLTIGVCVFLLPTQINQHAKWVRRKCDEIRSEQLAVGTSAGQNADREHEGDERQREKGWQKGLQEERNEGGRKAKWEEGRKTRLLQGIRNIVLDMCIAKAATTTQPIIQCATCWRCSATSLAHCMLLEI